VNRLFSVRAQIPKHDPDDRYHECTENTEQERVDHVKKIQYDRETGKRERQHEGEKKNNKIKRMHLCRFMQSTSEYKRLADCYIGEARSPVHPEKLPNETAHHDKANKENYGQYRREPSVEEF